MIYTLEDRAAFCKFMRIFRNLACWLFSFAVSTVPVALQAEHLIAEYVVPCCVMPILTVLRFFVM